MLAGLVAGLGAQLLGLLGRLVGFGLARSCWSRSLGSKLSARLGDLDDALDGRGGGGRHWLGRDAVQTLHLVGDFAQVRVDQAGLVTATVFGKSVRWMDDRSRATP